MTSSKVCVLCGTPWEPVANVCQNPECGGLCSWGDEKGGKPDSWDVNERGQWHPKPVLVERSRELLERRKESTDFPWAMPEPPITPDQKRYEVWHLGTGNYITSFDTEAEAQELVEEMVKLNGEQEREDCAIYDSSTYGDGVSPLPEGDMLWRRTHPKPDASQP